jgi:thioredoxin
MKRFIIITAMFLTLGTIAACASNDKKGTVIELTSEDFNNKVYDLDAENLKYLGDKPAIIDFNASWCGPCRKIAPILEELAAEYDGQIVIYKVDVDKCGDIASAFGIQSIPAILYIPIDGEPQMTVGSRGKEQFKAEIQKILLKK